MERNLPEPLMKSFEFSNLTSNQLYAFKARLRHIEEVIEKIESSLLSHADAGSFRSLLEQVELDVSVILGISESPEERSPWLIHSSWTFEVRGACLGEQIKSTIRSVMDEASPNILSRQTEYAAWLQRQTAALHEALDHFYSAKSFSETIAYLIAADVFLANIQAGSYKWHLAG